MNFPPYKVQAIAALKPYARNARTHSAEQVAQIAASIREFGFTNPLLVTGSGEIIAGHGRLEAAKSLRMVEVPCIVLDGLTPAQARALVIADNKLALNAGWDLDILRVELGELQAGGFDLGLTGFTLDEIGELLANGSEGLTDPDDAPPLPATPVSVLGDLWQLGSHRLVCGDSTDATTIDRLLAGVKPNLMVTDPPYGVTYDPNWRNDAAQAGAKSMRGAPGARATGKVQNDDRADWRDAWALFPGAVAYIWHGGVHAGVVADSLVASDFTIRAQIIWAKTRHAISRGHYHWQHEPCYYAVRDGATGNWKGDRRQTTLWMIEHRKSETGHGTQKPIDAMKRPIENNSSPGQAVYEPFSGSGTTLIACEMTGRLGFAVELDPGYVDVAVQRWQAFTGKQATLDGDGRTFDDLKAEREAKRVPQATRA